MASITDNPPVPTKVDLFINKNEDLLIGFTFIAFIVTLAGYYISIKKINANSTSEEKDVVGRWKWACIIVGALMVIVNAIMSGFTRVNRTTPIVHMIVGVILIIVAFVLPLIMKKQV